MKTYLKGQNKTMQIFSVLQYPLRQSMSVAVHLMAWPAVAKIICRIDAYLSCIFDHTIGIKILHQS